ncbi:hypothetical protein O6H91_04G036600 [Diphasiastrum complanatum]|uniref:Uncharacterized protein n=1 Tax=Diphasiastrum complanatum TaxID=34168 RepID=A0ACC2DVX9_DIPCM|nr:hypothetical protein O6H91_04G036600 [Diphasiastrum complanatum]
MRNLQNISKLKLNINNWIHHGRELKVVLKSPDVASASSVLETSLPQYAPRHGRLSSVSPPSSSSSGTTEPNFERESTLSVSEALSRVFATPSVFGPTWQSCSYHSWQLLLDTDHSTLSSESRERGQQQCAANPTLDMFQGKPGRELRKRLKWLDRELEESNQIGSATPHQLFRSKAGSTLRLNFSRHASEARALRGTFTRSACSLVGSVSSSTDSVADGNPDLESVSKEPCSRLRLQSGACCLPHPEKEKKGGEDAYFIASTEQVVGVADGVGGWADVGVDAGQYARELMAQSMLAIGNEPNGCIEPARILKRAHSRTKCKGSSTACILALSNDGLRAANLGDSGFIVLRNGQTVFKSPPQQHLFNIPYQLENGGSDPPSAAEVFCIPVVAGDVVVSGTDGLFDNLYDNELISTVVHSTRAGLDPETTARKLADLARLRAQDRNRQTPFSSAAQDAGYRFYGGKMDDITVIVSYITDSEPEENVVTV